MVKIIKYHLNFNFTKIYLFILVISLLESGIVFWLVNFSHPKLFNFNMVELLHLIIASFLIWSIIITLIEYFIYLTNKIYNIFLKCILHFFILTLIFIIVSIDLVSWRFYSLNEFFLSLELIKLTMYDFSQFLFGIMQTGFTILMSYLTLTFGSAIFIFWFLQRKQIKKRSNLKTYYLVLILINFVIILSFMISAKITKIHPISSLFTTSINNNPLNYKITDSLLVKRNTNPESPENFPDSPIIILFIESMRHDLIDIDPCPIPFIKSLGNQSYLFSRSYAASSHSDYADLALWYSKYPLRSFKRTKYMKNSLLRSTSIFQVFKNLNYETAYISSHNEKWGNMINWLDVPEMDFFFHSEDYNESTWYNKDDKGGLASLIKKKIATAGKVEDSETLKIAKDWISGLSDSTSFFLGMNLQNTHFNYLIPEGGEEPFQPSIIDFPMIYYNWSEKKVEHVKNRYNNAFYNLDILIKNFVDFLKMEGLWDNCYFIIIGDNGEAFYEHGFGNHSGPMYDEAVRTFTLIKPPKGFITYPVGNPISHIDILPGVLDLMNIPIPNSFQGFSPFKTNLKRKVYLHANAIVHQDGIIEWPWKLLVNYQPVKEAELYNLEIDPFEKRNLYNSYEKKANELFDKLMNWRNTQLIYYKNPEYYLIYEPPQIN